MAYSITVVNASTGEEELYKGDSVNSVHNDISNMIFNIKYRNWHLSEADRKRKMREIKKDLAVQTTKQIESLIISKKQILIKSLNDDINVWDYLKSGIVINFGEPEPQPKTKPNTPEYFQIPIRPQPTDKKYMVNKLFSDKIFRKKYLHKVSKAQYIFHCDLTYWENTKIEIDSKNQELKSTHDKKLDDIRLEYDYAVNEWENRKRKFEENQKRNLEKINELKVDTFLRR